MKLWLKEYHIFSPETDTVSLLTTTSSTVKIGSNSQRPGLAGYKMATAKLPPIETVQFLTTEERAAILDLLFEPSTQLHTLAVPLLHQQKFQAWDDLIATIGNQLTELSESASTSDTAWLEDILVSHPRLGAKKVDSAQSQAEQAQLQGNAEEGEQLRALNEEYERKYPGLRYVVFVNGRSRPAIMDDMRSRISNSDLKTERLTAIRVSTSISERLRAFHGTKLIVLAIVKAMCEIAADRATKLH